MSTDSQPLLILVGPTAIGKTALSLKIARRWDCEIVSVDSMQVYRYMDIGTAKVSRAEMQEITHHLIDIVNPDEPYDASRFRFDARNAIADIRSRNKIPLLTGGTGLYLRALLEGLAPGLGGDELIREQLRKRAACEGINKLHEDLFLYDRKSAERININDHQRILRALEIYLSTGTPWSEHLKQEGETTQKTPYANVLQICLTCEREILYGRINQRCRKMLDMGLETEVKNLLSMGYAKTLKPFGAIGYRHMLRYLEGSWSRAEMIDLLARDTRRYAKRQLTWFKNIEAMRWVEVTNEQAVEKLISSWLKSLEHH